MADQLIIESIPKAEPLGPCEHRRPGPSDQFTCQAVHYLIGSKVPNSKCTVGADACRHCLLQPTKPNSVIASMALKAAKENLSPDDQATVFQDVRHLLETIKSAPVKKATANDLPCVYRGESLRDETCELCGTAKGEQVTVYACQDEANKSGECSPSRFSNSSKKQTAKVCAGCDRRKPPEGLIQLEGVEALRVDAEGTPAAIPAAHFVPANKAPCRLTIGMATYDDEPGVWMTVQALRLYHAGILKETNAEILVVDSNPGQHIYGPDGKRIRTDGSKHGAEVRELCNNWGGGPNGQILRYIPAEYAKGTSAPRDLVFREARGEIVLCIDCHVMLPPGAIAALVEYFDDHPDSIDLIQGPMLHHGCEIYATHMRREWGEDLMLGKWETDERIKSIDKTPFDIPGHGMGLFAQRKLAWRGFHPDFKGFGGEEIQYHDKVRAAGGKCLCLPELEWLHKFSRVDGVPYPLRMEDRFRNYLIGHMELGKDVSEVLRKFSGKIPNESYARIVQEVMGIFAGEKRNVGVTT